MDRKGYLKILSAKRDELNRIHNEINSVDKKYISDCCAFKIGDILKVDGYECTITGISVENDGSFLFWYSYYDDGSVINSFYEESMLVYLGIKTRK